jgi:hypothetical protein
MDAFNMRGLLRQYNFMNKVLGHKTARMTKERFLQCMSVILSPIPITQETLQSEGFLELN